jgi:DNA-directed RNA polymerase subunit RPC12/RpoP
MMVALAGEALVAVALVGGVSAPAGPAQLMAIANARAPKTTRIMTSTEKDRPPCDILNRPLADSKPATEAQNRPAPVETIGEAWQLSWRVSARRAYGKGDDSRKKGRECQYSEELDLGTLVWTRGPSFPLDQLTNQLKCPACGSRIVRVLFTQPTNMSRVSARA